VPNDILTSALKAAGEFPSFKRLESIQSHQGQSIPFTVGVTRIQGAMIMDNNDGVFKLK